MQTVAAYKVSVTERSCMVVMHFGSLGFFCMDFFHVRETLGVHASVYSGR